MKSDFLPDIYCNFTLAKEIIIVKPTEFNRVELTIPTSFYFIYTSIKDKTLIELMKLPKTSVLKTFTGTLLQCSIHINTQQELLSNMNAKPMDPTQWATIPQCGTTANNLPHLSSTLPYCNLCIGTPSVS